MAVKEIETETIKLTVAFIVSDLAKNGFLRENLERMKRVMCWIKFHRTN